MHFFLSLPSLHLTSNLPLTLRRTTRLTLIAAPLLLATSGAAERLWRPPISGALSECFILHDTSTASEAVRSAQMFAGVRSRKGEPRGCGGAYASASCACQSARWTTHASLRALRASLTTSVAPATSSVALSTALRQQTRKA